MKAIVEISVMQKFAIIILFVWAFELSNCKSIAQSNSIQVPVDSSYIIFNGRRVALKEYYHPSSKWALHDLSLTSDGLYIINSNKGIFGGGLTEFIAEEKLVDKQANYRIMHHNRFGKTNRAPGQSLDTRSQGEMLTFQAL